MTTCGFYHGVNRSLKKKYQSLYLGAVELPIVLNTNLTCPLEVNHRGILVKVIDVKRYNLNPNIQYSLDSLKLLPSTPAQDNSPGIDILFNTIHFLDFIRETTGRLNVVDDDTLIALFNVDNLDNAYWTGSYMVFGNGQTEFKPLVSPDVIAHELSHALVQSCGGLVYLGESGALNESLADCFGVAYEFWLYKKFNEDKDKFNDISGVPDYYIGEDITKTSRKYLRDLQDPFLSLQPKQYGGHFWLDPKKIENDNGGVHFNSGVSNHLFYLVSKEITVPVAINLWYRVLQRLKPDATFDDFSWTMKNVVSVEHATVVKEQLIKVSL
jgi:Zn-dependent metalloprotease